MVLSLEGCRRSVPLTALPDNAAVAPRITSARFIGRVQEIERLDAALERSAVDAPVTVVLIGEAGIGKSRLLREFEERGRARGWRVLSGDCVQVGSGGLPYGPIVDALGGLVAEVGEAELRWMSEPAQSPLGKLLPGLVEHEAAADGGDLDTAQWRLFGSILTLFERLGEERGLVFTVDDIQWADRSTRALLRFLVASLRSPRIVMVFAARGGAGEEDADLAAFFGELWRHPRVERVDVRQFDRSEVAAHMAELRGRAPDRDDVDSMLGRSDGNPFYIEVLAATAMEPDERLPAPLKDVVLSRIRELDDDAVTAVEAAAIAGRLVDHDLLAAVAGLPSERLAAGLRAAIEAGLLEVDRTGERYRFHHALQQEAVYSRVLPADRRALHLAYARLLEGRPRAGSVGQAAEIAHHLDAAREPMRAIPALLRAARAAIDLYAFHQALSQLERALALADLHPDAAAALNVDRVELLGIAAEAASNGGLAAEAVGLGRRAVDLDNGSDARRTANLRERLSDYLVQVGEMEAGLAELRRAALLVEHVDGPERARVGAAMARTLMLTSDLGAAVSLAEDALDAARQWPGAGGGSQRDDHAGRRTGRIG